MRLRRIEFVVIALTLGFACFLGGYFAGARGSVNVVTVETQNGETLQISTGVSNSPSGTAAQPSPETQSSPADGSGATTQADFASPPGGSSEAALQEPFPASPSESAAPGSLKGGDGRININTATRSELMDLPGIGEVIAGRIIDYRTQHGAFASIEDIKKVSGIGEKKFDAMRDKITVG